MRVLPLGTVGLVAALAGTSVPAQDYAVSPGGLEVRAGNTESSLPFRGVSATYQQIHGATDLVGVAGGQSLAITGLHFRPHATFALPARQFELQLSLGETSVAPEKMGFVFANNFSATPTVVRSYGMINLPAAKGIGADPNPVAWKVPFAGIFIYAPSNGNLIWEWRHRNGGALLDCPIDAVNSIFTGGSAVLPSLGSGCVATGQTMAAAAEYTVRSGQLEAALRRGPANAPAVMWLGFDRVRTSVPGFCSDLYVMPALTKIGRTDAQGSWIAGRAPWTALAVDPYVEVGMQFGFADPGLGAGLGLTDLGRVSTPSNGGKFVSRLYRVGGANGEENATAGFLSLNNALVTMFRIL